MRYHIIFILMLILAQSCRNVSTDYSEVSFDREETAEWIGLSSDLEIGVPLSMTVDSTTIYVLSVAGGNIIHGFSVEDGRKTLSWGTVGQGPEEFITPVNCQAVNGNIVAYDAGDNAIKSIGTDGTFFQKFSLPGTKVVNEAFYIAPSAWVGIGKNRSITVYSANERKDVYDALPGGLDNAEKWYDLQARTAFVDQHLFFANLVGGFLESFKINTDSINLVKRVRLPDCNVAFNSSGNIDYKSITYGFTALCAANGYCFGAFSASTDPNSNSKIGVWDYNLNPIVCLNTNKLVIYLCSDGKKLYALTHNPETGFCLDYISYTSHSLPLF